VTTDSSPVAYIQSAWNDVLKNDSCLIGFSGAGVPLDILDCYGTALPLCLIRTMLPERIQDGRPLPADFCDISRGCSTLEVDLSILPAHLIAVFSINCGSMLRVCEALRDRVKTYVIDTPRSQEHTTDLEYLISEYQGLIQFLDANTGVRLTAARLREAILQRNRVRGLIADLVAPRDSRTCDIDGVLMKSIVQSQYFLPHDYALRYLNGLRLQSTEGNEPSAPDKDKRNDRIFLVGNILAELYHSTAPSSFIDDFIRGIKAAGFTVAGNAVFQEGLIALAGGHTVTDILRHLGRFHLEQSAHTYRLDPRPSAEAAVRQAHLARADGVIYGNLKFCETSAFEAGIYEDTFRKAGLPFLKLEISADSSRSSQLSTRLATFREMLNT
jgi:hypothetical protein